jgi:shikimate dehydrogenase
MTKACIMGWPVAHSRSPLIHGHWLKMYGIKGVYERQPVEPQHFPQFLRSLGALGYAGGNVTVPHKEAAFRAVERRDAAALAVGAVNTVWIENGELCGGNTDVRGFLASMDEQAPGWDAGQGRAAVLGAGGAARAILRGLLDRGFSVKLLNRTEERARELAAAFGLGVEVRAWEEKERVLADCRALINTTSLAMKGQPPLDIDLTALPPEAVVCDIVYAPLETPLLRDARARGLRAVDGLGMLLHQAAPGFERWFGVRPEVTPELRALIAADVEAV